MKIILKQTHHAIADFKARFGQLQKDLLTKRDESCELFVYPELFLTGYPLQDLVLQREFIEKYLQSLQELHIFLKENHSLSKNKRFLVGGLTYEFDEDGLPLYIRNVVFDCCPGEGIKPLYTKCLLPNYDIFDERKYYTPGEESCILNIFGQKVGLLICEDMWFSSTHQIDPVENLYQKTLREKIKLDFIVNLSGSPFFLGKQEKRVKRAKEIASLFHCPFIYVNCVGGEDEILFDGQSFVLDGENLQTAKAFEADELISTSTPRPSSPPSSSPQRNTSFHSPENSWQSQFKANFSQGPTPLSLTPWSDKDCEEAISALSFGLQEYATKCGFNSFSVALSGGIDSGLVLTLAKMSLREGQELEALYMPSHFSSKLSTKLAKELCQGLHIPLTIFPISPLHAEVQKEFTQFYHQRLEGLSDENIQSRLRGTLLYTRSNQKGSMVINTSNKSELAVGYSTLYGDSVGALSLLGDVYKSEVYTLAKYINKTRGLIPKDYIERPPSAELRENQWDQEILPPYPLLDTILEGLLSYRYSVRDLIQMGLPEEEVKKVYGLYVKSEYKRKQFCPIIKVRAKSFGFGYRVPIAKKI